MPFKDIEKKKEYSKNYYKKNKLKNKDKAKESHRLYYLKNKEKIKTYTENNKERKKKYHKEYRLKNNHLINALQAKRRSLKLNATPKFANLNKIKEIYKNCPKGYTVDHIIPLQGNNVCGLHVEWNLQYLTRSENSSKSNKLII
jgi:hypothetical protein